MDKYILFLLIGIGILTEILHLFGVMKSSIEPISILVYISMMISLLSILIVRKMSDIETAIRFNDSKIVALPLDGFEQFYQKAAEEILKATRTVDVTHFYVSSPDSAITITPTDNSYFNAIENILKEKKKTTFRRIVSINTLDKYESVKETIQIFENQDNFHLNYTDRVHDDFPILNVLIIDQTKVFIGIYEHVSIEEKAIFFDDTVMASLFGHYFNHIWEKSKPLKSGRTINTKLLSEIENNLNI